MNLLKYFAVVFVALATVVSTFAAPITVEDFTIDENNGNYLLLVDFANTVVGEEFTQVSFTIEELGTSKEVEIIEVPLNTTSQVEVYNLMDVTDNYDLLKKGEAYTITVSTDDSSSMTQSFFFGSERDTEGLDVLFEEVEVNGNSISDGDSLQVLNGETLEIDMRVYAYENIEDARLRVFVEGYEHDTLISSTEIFSLVEGKTYTKTLSVSLPSDMDSQADYKLRIEGANDLSGLTYKEYTLYVDTQRHRVDVLDLVMTPSSGVEPGQNLIANVRLKNRGQQSQESVKVLVEIPELGVSEASYVSYLDTNEAITSDDMLVFVPENAEAKAYEVIVSLEYNDGYTESSSSYSLNVLSPKLVEEEDLIVSYSNNIELEAGESTSFDIVIANPNSEAKPISLGALETVWADVSVSPSLAMVAGGSDATFRVSVTPKSAVEGEKDLTLSVKEGTATVADLTLSTYVEESDELNMTNVILAVLLVIAIIILLALVVTIARRRNDDEEEDTEEYY